MLNEAYIVPLQDSNHAPMLDKKCPENPSSDERATDTENVVDLEDNCRSVAPNSYTKTDFLIIGLKVVLFLILWALFIEIQFGAVFFVFSVIVFICYNTKKKSKTDKSPSAYSVFNRNCERLDGQFTAEQFERELRGGFVAQ